MKNKVSPPKTDPSTYTVNSSLKSLANDPFIVLQREKLRVLLNKSKELKLQNS
ncbi:hypothetical protein LV89_03893 [Arcicella aurantiaca]|uniref:Uncharacterized protein n=1 Tax=Arcicella aurantiaca TaxID=591202 RepID=A0A316DU37_9BACT|nr:hypothetical protein [Arcicella aurantiaca]PWK20083.1 hypothetical protein LV89_03893 [Arcicella aurantiaca]